VLLPPGCLRGSLTVLIAAALTDVCMALMAWVLCAAQVQQTCRWMTS
jgi:hypothetical protein